MSDQFDHLTNEEVLARVDDIRRRWASGESIDDATGTLYGELRKQQMWRGILEKPIHLTYGQCQVVMHDSVPAKPDPRSWTPEEYEEKLAEYDRRIGYKLSPLGNYVYRGPRSTDPQDQPLPELTPEEREANRGFFERWQEERRRARNIA